MYIWLFATSTQLCLAFAFAPLVGFFSDVRRLQLENLEMFESFHFTCIHRLLVKFTEFS